MKYPSSLITNLPAQLDVLRDLNVFHLSDRADCASPENLGSAGAHFLDAVRNDAVDLLESLDADGVQSFVLYGTDGDLSDDISERADSAVPIYTHQLWATFVDLAAYNEDATELGADASDLDQCARTCLYLIADRLLRTLIDAACSDTYAVNADEALDAARQLGTEHGKNAAAWWEQDAIGGRSSGDVKITASTVLKGLEDGYPEILDALPHADLSGQWADGMTPQILAEECDVPNEALETDAGADFLDLLCCTYKAAFNLAAQDAVETACIAVLAQD